MKKLSVLLLTIIACCMLWACGKTATFNESEEETTTHKKNKTEYSTTAEDITESSERQTYSDRNSFTRDGIVNEDAWIKGEKILFILKEANISEQLKDASEGNVIADNGKFWFRETIKSNNYNWKKKIFRRLRKIGESWTGNKDFSLESVAYMNINKRGGLSQAKEDVIDGYFEKYQSLILEEIKIINPSKIAICCGDQGYVGKLDELIKKWDKSIEIKHYNHPSKRWGTDEEYLKGI